MLQNILDKFNPGARQLINAGKAYLKALHGEFFCFYNTWDEIYSTGFWTMIFKDNLFNFCIVYFTLHSRTCNSEMVFWKRMFHVREEFFFSVLCHMTRCGRVPTFWRNVLSAFSVMEAVVSSQHWYLSTRLQGVIAITPQSERWPVFLSVVLK